jgi:hypothetical protein
VVNGFRVCRNQLRYYTQVFFVCQEKSSDFLGKFGKPMAEVSFGENWERAGAV